MNGSMVRVLTVRGLLLASIAATAVVGIPTAASADVVTAAPVRVAPSAAEQEVPQWETTEEERVKAFSVLALGDPEPALLLMSDRDFVNEIWKRSTTNGEVRATAELALMENDQDGYVAFIQGGIHAAQARQIANDLVADAALRAARSLRRNAAAEAGLVADEAMLLLSEKNVVVEILLRAKGSRVRAAAEVALKGGAAELHEFLATGVKAAAELDLKDLLADREDKRVEEAERLKRLAAMRSAAAVLGVVASDGMLAMTDANFIVEIWNTAVDGTEVHAAAVKAVRSNDPVAQRAFIDTGIHDANRRDIQKALDRKAAADRRLVEAILTQAQDKGWRNMVAAATEALAAGPDAMADFLRVGQYQVAPDRISAKQLALAGDRVGVLNSGGVANVNKGALTAPWVKQYTAVKQVVLDGDRIGVLTTDGTAYVKEGGLSALWTKQRTGVTQLVLAGDRIGVLTTDGNASVKEGSLNAGWRVQHPGVTQLALSGNRIGVVTADGTAKVKEGGLSAGWITERTRVRQLVLAGDRIGVLIADGTASVKEGGLSAGWRDQHPGVTQLALAADRIGVVTADGTAKVKDGGLSAGWVVQHGQVGQLVLAGTRIGVVTRDGTAKVKEGGLSAGWVIVQKVETRP
jgi:hypothetical protein